MQQIAKTIKNSLSAGLSGGTVNLQSKHVDFESGYMVATISEVIDYPCSTQQIKHACIKVFSRCHNALFGFWLHDGKLFIDSVKHVQNFTDAMKLGTEHNQISIWDCEKEKEIRLMQSI